MKQMMELFLVVFGLLFGSAANAIIDRLPRRESWFAGRSHCDKCQHELSFFDLIPVISYVSLGGKCRYCHSPIPRRNLIIEILMGTGFLFFGIWHLPWVYFAILWITVIIAVMDWETMLVSEWLVAIWALLVVLNKINNLGDLKNVIGLAIGVGLIGGIWLLSKGRAMGFGDVEIAAVMGFWLGWPTIFWALEVAFISGAAVGLIKILQKKSKLKSHIAFGTFLIFGAWVLQLINVPAADNFCHLGYLGSLCNFLVSTH